MRFKSDKQRKAVMANMNNNNRKPKRVPQSAIKTITPKTREIEIVYTGDDNWGRAVYRDVNTNRIYKSYSGVGGSAQLYTTTKDGEPIGPIRKDIKVITANKKLLPKTKTQQTKIAKIQREAKEANNITLREFDIISTQDKNLYASRRRPIEKNLGRKYDKGTYDEELGILAWYNYAKEAQKRYNEREGANVISNAEVASLAIEEEKYWRGELELGNR